MVIELVKLTGREKLALYEHRRNLKAVLAYQYKDAVRVRKNKSFVKVVEQDLKETEEKLRGN